MRWLVVTAIDDGTLHEPGETIEMSPETAAVMPWAVAALPEEPPPVEEPKPAKKSSK